MVDDLAQRRRLARVLSQVRVPDAPPVLLESHSNDTWRIGAVILRVCWRGDLDRFAREQAVVSTLPPSVPYPTVLGTGRDAEVAWQVTSVVEGTSLFDVWPTLSMAQRRSATHETGRILAALNAHPFPSDVRALIGAPRPAPDSTVEDLIGADLNPVPSARALLMIEPARALPHVDPRLIDDVAGCLRSLADIDPLNLDTGPGSQTRHSSLVCVHGDAHLRNVLWKDQRVVALLDFEWVRLGPLDLELEPYLRDIPGASDHAQAMTRETLGWLAEAHPVAFAHPKLSARLWLYQLGFLLRQLLILAPDRPAADLAGDHPLLQLCRIVDGPAYLHRLMPDAAH